MTYDYIKENGEFVDWKPQEVAAAKAVAYADELVKQAFYEDTEKAIFNSSIRGLILDNSISHTAKYIYCYMSCQPDGCKFYLETMSKDIGISVGTLKKYLRELIGSGWISKGNQQNENGKFGAVEYRLNAK